MTVKIENSMKSKLIIVFVLVFYGLNAQIKVPEIPVKLKENANSIVLDAFYKIEIKSIDKVLYFNKSTTLIYNKKGLNNVSLSEGYDKSTKIKSIKAKVFNQFGKLIKEIKKSDFKDQSIADGVSVFTDDRVLSFEYLTDDYPIIIEYESEIESRNTALLRGWSPYQNLYESHLSTKFEVVNESGIKLNKFEKNIQNFNIEAEVTENRLSYLAQNLDALKEEQSANYLNEFPKISITLDKVSLEGIEINTTSWQNFGKDYYVNFLKDNNKVSEATKQKLAKLISQSDSKIDIIKKVYQFVQETTRYVSVQVGVGGWKPMEVSDVEKYGYGDCKALSNYARALLDTYNIESYFTIIYGGEKKDINEEIIAIQGNHAILTVPNEKEYIFLECTSQVNPYNYMGTFTSNRKALIIKPTGGEIIPTLNYSPEENYQKTAAVISLFEDGKASGKVKIDSKLIQYKNVFFLDQESKEEQDKYYQNYFTHLNQVKVKNVKYFNDKNNFNFNQQFDIEAQNYLEKSGNTLILPINMLNRIEVFLPKQRNRKFNFEISYGYTDEDEVLFEIPEGYLVKNLPEKLILTNEFGNYTMELVSKESKIIYKRIIKINEGVYKKEQYDTYRNFRDEISKHENLKIILEKK